MAPFPNKPTVSVDIKQHSTTVTCVYFVWGDGEGWGSIVCEVCVMSSVCVSVGGEGEALCVKGEFCSVR